MTAITILKVFLAFIAILMVANLVRSLTYGTIRFGSERLGIFGERTKTPRDFWLIFVANLGAILFFLWLIFR